VQAQTTPTSIHLAFTTPADDSLVGTASQFDLRYSTSPITASNFASAIQVAGLPAPAAPGTQQSFTVTGLQPATTYWFAIKTADEVPNWSGISNVVSRATLAAPDVIAPARIANLSVTGVNDTTASIAWSAVGDDSLTGLASSYDIRYATTPITASNWAAAVQVANEPTPASPGTSQSYTVRGLSRQVTYYFAIRAVDDAGNMSILSNVPSATTPDTMKPASVNDLVAGFAWFGWHATADLARPRATGLARR